MTQLQQFNHLRDEESAYLKQHNQNPVDWHPYGPEALQLAKDENRPIFLSIGYSSCHWCHVMAHESFEDVEIAKILNEHFVCIKIDKEELPDLDNYFQLACQVMNGRGGWPLSAFLTSEFKPFFIGTYFPKFSTEGLPSFREVITNMAQAYREEFNVIQANAEQVITALKAPPKVENKVEFEGHYPAAAAVLNALKNYEDNDFGGYGIDPKFPHFSFLEWAIEHMLEGMIPPEQGKHIIFSIERILLGGIYDHVRGGIHRYSVDQSWTVPHFEKMLYDQAGLLKLLAKASLIYPSPLVFDSMMQTLDYLSSEMLSEKGYFFSGQDADSEGVEGLYFTFSKNEFIEAIKDYDEELLQDQEEILNWFNITEKGNFEDGLSVISLNPKYTKEFYAPEAWNKVRKVQSALLAARKQRIPPATDNKGVASWNFQLVVALIDVIQYCKVDAIRHAASELLTKCNEGINSHFLYKDENDRTRIHTTTSRQRHVPLLEDYVMFSEYSFRCFELTGDQNFYINAVGTLRFIFKHFYKDKCLYTRSIEYNETEFYENIHTPIFDQSYKSAMATLIILLKKWCLVEPELKEFLKSMEPSIETLTHLSLQNPLAFGETLRALVYPDEAYRKIEVPKKWYQDRRIDPFFSNFSVRFALCAHEEENHDWQICSALECELMGNNFEEFKKVFTPQVDEDNAE